MIVNTHQAEAWNGYEGVHWATHHDRYNAVNDAFNPFLLDAVRPGDRVLDIGCGTGRTTRLAAARALSAEGVDLSEPMLAAARELAKDLVNVAFTHGDAQVHPFPGSSFDLAVSRFGIMFFGDPVAAFANIGRALTPGGRLTFLSLRGYGDLARVVAALGFPEAPPGTGPLALGEAETVERVLTAAGFTGVVTRPVDAPQNWGADAADAASFLAAWGPVRHNAGDGAAERMLPALRTFETAGGVLLNGEALLVSAVRP
ncbi:class I SAM-dependent methyltransferase [Herbidospora mongoliensis]|uniref:class I SAM-dependent methyltransferase n=1 Tax=Herbidospora mongoliensis TaxID=688067 RepID=UPI00082D30BB|nr:class I SAM-dependent methyltransferase [Herbidospora mongoliensis]